MNFPVDNISHVLSHSLLGELRSLCNSTGEDPWKLVCGFLQTLPHVSFPFANFTLNPFTIINPIPKYDFKLSPLNPLSEF